MKKITILIVFVALFLTGCYSSAGDELLKVPKLPSDYIALQKQIDIEISDGKVQVAPESGSNRNTVQLVDIDGDGEEEAIAFFRENAISGNFEIVIYEQNDDEYEEVGRIYGEGSSIDFVHYPRFSVTGGGGIIVSWKIGDSLQKGMTAVTYEDDDLQIVLDTNYLHTFNYDINGNGTEDIFLINSKETNLVLEMYEISGKELILVDSAPLSKEAGSVSRVTTGVMVSGGRSIAIDSTHREKTGLTSDFIAYENKKLINVTESEQNIDLFNTYRETNSYSTKLFNDNVIYIPTVTAMKGTVAQGSTVSFVTRWHLFDNYNPTENNLYTYHNNSDGWFLFLDEELKDYVTVTRENLNDAKIIKIGAEISPGNRVELFEIYTISKDNFNENYFSEGYISLAATQTNVYIAKNLNPNHRLGYTSTEIMENFKLISSN